MRDYQRQRLYAWERAYVHPKMPSEIRDESYLQTLIDYMWSEMGYSNPPKLAIRNGMKTKSHATRYEIWMSASMMRESIMNHELAHSVNRRENALDTYDSHGPHYVADLCAMLVRFYRFDVAYLLFTLRKARVDINEQHMWNKLREWQTH